MYNFYFKVGKDVKVKSTGFKYKITEEGRERLYKKLYKGRQHWSTWSITVLKRTLGEPQLRFSSELENFLSKMILSHKVL